MKVKLLQYSDISILIKAIRICHESEARSDNMGEIDQKLVKNVIKMGHTSVLEHIVYTFEIDGVSRVLLAQLTRHRMASYSVRSQRYVEVHDNNYYILPNSIQDDENIRKIVEEAGKTYQHLIKNGVKKEDARFILPQATATHLIMTINARSLRNFFKLRLSKKAQWEIRNLAKIIYDIIPPEHKIIFSDIYLPKKS